MPLWKHGKLFPLLLISLNQILIFRGAEVWFHLVVGFQELFDFFFQSLSGDFTISISIFKIHKYAFKHKPQI